MGNSPPSSAVQDPTGSGSVRPGNPRRDQAGRGVCAFWLGERCYGLDIQVVGGVVAVEALVPVPRVPPTILGLFNLRGAAVALVDLAAVLDLPRPPTEGARSQSALVLRSGDLYAGALIDRVEAVFAQNRGAFRPLGGEGEHPAVAGMFDVDIRGGLTVTVLDTKVVLDKLSLLKFRRGGARA